MDTEQTRGERTRLFSIVFVLTLLAGAVLRLYDLGGKSVWFDEIHTFNDARETYHFWGKSHILYFLIVRASLFFGRSEIWLRLPSALFGILSIPLLYFAALEITGDRRTALLAAFLLALNRIHIQHSQEARFYPAMFFWSALGIYLFGLFLRKGSLAALALLPVCALAGYLTHPTTLVFSGMLLAWALPSLFMDPRGREHLRGLLARVRALFPQAPASEKGGKKRNAGRGAKKAPFPWPSAVMGAVLLLAGGYFAWRMTRIGLGWMRHVRWFNIRPEGVSFSRQFFYNQHFVFYGPGIVFKGLLGMYAVMLYALCSLVGYGRLVWRRPAFGIIFIAGIVMTFILLFSITLNQHYLNKYVIYLFPINLIALAWGFMAVFDFLAGRLTRLFPNRRGVVILALALVFGVPHLLKETRLIAAHYRFQSANVRDAVAHAAAHMGPEDTLAAYDVICGPVSYYADVYRIPRERLLLMKGESGDGTRSIHLLQNAVRNGGRFYFVFGWPHSMRPRLESWVKNNSEHILTRKYFTSDPSYDVSLWGWKYPGAFISGDHPISFQADFQPLEPDDAPEGETGWLEFNQPFYAGHAMKAVLEPGETGMPFLPGVPGRILLDKTPVTSGTLDLMTNGVRQLELPAGGGRLRIQARPLKGAEVSGRKTVPLQLRSAIPDIYIPAASYDSASPTFDIQCLHKDDISTVRMPYNSFLMWDIPIMENGIFQFRVKARHDAPGPVTYHVEVDDRPVGLLSFARGDNSLQEQGFPLDLEAGTRRIALYFISDNYSDKTLPEERDTDSYCEYITLTPVMKDSERTDQRILKNAALLVPVSEAIPGDVIKLSPDPGGWKASEGAKVTTGPRNMAGRARDALHVEIAQDSRGADIQSPVFPVRPDRLVFFSVKAGCATLKNHSANVMLFYLGQGGQVVGRQWVNAQGITGDVDEVKYVCLSKPPSGAAAAVIGLMVYPNGSKPWAETGYVWFHDFRSGAAMLLGPD